MTKTLRPFFSPPDAEAGDDELLDELPDELHAASTEAATRSTAGAHSTRFRDRLILNPFNPNGRTLPGWVSRNSADPAGGCAGPGVVAGARWPRARNHSRDRATTDPAVGTKTLMSRSPPVTIPVASWLKLVSSRGSC